MLGGVSKSLFGAMNFFQKLTGRALGHTLARMSNQQPPTAPPVSANPATASPAPAAKPRSVKLKKVDGPTEKSFSVTQKRNDREMFYTGGSMEWENAQIMALAEETYDEEANKKGIAVLRPTEVNEFFTETQPGDVIGIATCAYTVADKTAEEIILAPYEHKKNLRRMVNRKEEEFGYFSPSKTSVNRGELDVPMFSGLCEILYRNGQVYGAEKLYFEVEEGQTPETE